VGGREGGGAGGKRAERRPREERRNVPSTSNAGPRGNKCRSRERFLVYLHRGRMATSQPISRRTLRKINNSQRGESFVMAHFVVDAALRAGRRLRGSPRIDLEVRNSGPQLPAELIIDPRAAPSGTSSGGQHFGQRRARGQMVALMQDTTCPAAGGALMEFLIGIFYLPSIYQPSPALPFIGNNPS
jgi:hypothetical protein